MKNKKNNFKFCLKIFVGLILICGIGIFIYLFSIIQNFPRPEVFSEISMNQNTNIYDRTGEILLSSIYGEEKRKYVTLDKIPEILKQAIIATEDGDFYTHHGIDFSGLLRAMRNNILSGSLLSQGASTLDQQLIRSTFLTKEKKIERKIKEAILAIELDRRYDKDQILEWYINQVPFGINIYGAEEAANTYFKKELKDISLEEAAMLAAIIQLPSYYSPYGDHVDELMIRKNYVLDRMAIENYITKEKAEETKNIEIVFNQKPQTKASHFVDYIEKQLEETYGKDFLETKGLKIYTSLDWNLQQKGEEIVKKEVNANAKTYNAYNASLVAMNPKNGEILAMIGSADPWADPYPEGCDPSKTCKFVPSFNVATIGNRQPGSSFKPFAYAEAVIKGYKPDLTLVKDELTNFGNYGGEDYIPKNYDGRFRGWVTLRSALAQSLNIPAVKVILNLAGIDDTIALATKMGITTLNQTPNYYGPALVLGGGEVHLLDMVSAYSVFSNGGYRVPPVSILKIEDANGNILYQNNNTPRKVLGGEIAETMMDVLSDNNARSPMFGSNSLLYIPNYKVAVKTGTTQNFVDGWTMGTCDLITVGVWAGNNDNSSMNNKALGTSTAGPIWNEFINYAINYLR
ncbi:MAG: transglycosylase domain-containing protein [Candidatus Pacebacteria bacterium]|nr:transglycosylase domain-containing protein [Candidatus Paceibacterota bacterium]